MRPVERSTLPPPATLPGMGAHKRVQVAVQRVPVAPGYGPGLCADVQRVCAPCRWAAVPAVVELNKATWIMASRARSRATGCAGALCICSTCLSQPSSTPRAHQHLPVFMDGGAPGHRHKAQGLACSCFGVCVGPRRRDIGIAWPCMPACVCAPDPAWCAHLKPFPSPDRRHASTFASLTGPDRWRQAWSARFFGGRAPS